MQVRKNRLLFFTLIWYLLAFLAVALPAWAQPNETTEWTWMGGSSAIAQPGVYGTMGSPAGGNIPGNRVNASSWNDGNGHLWLFGGYGTDSTGVSGYLNDLWEFNPSTNEWTWMGGGAKTGQTGVYGTPRTPAAANFPGSRWMLPVGPTAVAASGSSASGAMMLPETLVISMTFGSSTLQPTSGRE